MGTHLLTVAFAVFYFSKNRLFYSLLGGGEREGEHIASHTWLS